MSVQKTYLGDGLYCEDEGYQFRLFTERFSGDVHEVFLEPEVLQSFIDFVAKQRGLKITVERKAPNE